MEITIILCNILILSSCSKIDVTKESILDFSDKKISEVKQIAENKYDDFLYDVYDSEKAERRIEQIIYALSSEDKDELISLYSEKAILQDDDFYSNVDYLYDEILGNVDSWEEADGSMGVSKSTNYGVKTIEIDSFYYVYIDNVKYFFLVNDKPVYDTDSSEEGLWFLLIVEETNEELIWDGSNKIIYDGNDKIERSGLLIPFR